MRRDLARGAWSVVPLLAACNLVNHPRQRVGDPYTFREVAAGRIVTLTLTARERNGLVAFGSAI
jgi:hypothetical protein